MRAALVVVLGVSAALPSVASAHVGRTLPVATNFTARVTKPLTGLDAKVMDGDQTLWLRTPASATVLVPGAVGEPLLRFDPHGLWLNLRSPTAKVDRIDRFDLETSDDPRALPLWHRLTWSHAYAWHEHRLHALEPLARGRRSAGWVGAWAVPLVIDGRHASLDGVLEYRPAGRTWIWIGASVVVALLTAATTTRSPAGLVALGFAATPLIWALRIGRELYGRPTVGWTGYLGIAVTSAVGGGLLAGLLHRDDGIRTFTAVLVGVGGVYQGLTMLPLLTHAIALSALPSEVARAFEVLVLGLGIGVLAGAVLRQLRANDAEIDSSGAAV